MTKKGLAESELGLGRRAFLRGLAAIVGLGAALKEFAGGAAASAQAIVSGLPLPDEPVQEQKGDILIYSCLMSIDGHIRWTHFNIFHSEPPLFVNEEPAASSGASKKTHFERNCRVGGGVKRRYPPGACPPPGRRGTMGIRESILSKAEGLNPSYAGIAAQQAAGN
jgi:hypothetical protein